jgi:hypothetical protein
VDVERTGAPPPRLRGVLGREKSRPFSRIRRHRTVPFFAGALGHDGSVDSLCVYRNSSGAAYMLASCADGGSDDLIFVCWHNTMLPVVIRDCTTDILPGRLAA